MKTNIEVLITIENQRISMRNLGLEFLDYERESENEHDYERERQGEAGRGRERQGEGYVVAQPLLVVSPR